MFQNRTIALCAAVLVSVMLVPAATFAQPMGASEASSSVTSKAQRKAESKARRARKNAELTELKKHGYNAAGSQATYPQNVQNAEARQKPSTNAIPASAP
ncbi:hypothetical protein [Paraburkholderia sacchari]|uniref:hypothetical protein n=1 Tax=Paraburkholderia sacchari TaxID=159450 RepID=UPI001BD17317|nr:hypothetical protein [Paraburkholderia sacchari]